MARSFAPLAVMLFALPTAAHAEGLDDLDWQSEPIDFSLSDEVELFNGSEFDTGWIPEGSPLKVRFQIQSLGGAEIEMEGVAHLGWPEGLTVGLEPVVGSGLILVDASLDAVTSIQFDVAGYTWDSEIDRRGIPVEGEAVFDPFLLVGAVPADVRVTYEGATNELVNYSYNVFTGVSVQFTVDIGPQATTTYDSTTWYVNSERLDGEGERVVVVPQGLPTQTVDVDLVGHWQSTMDLVLNPVFSVCVDIVGCWDLVDIDIPLPLASDDFEQIFPHQTFDFPLPVMAPPMEAADFGTVVVGEIANIEVPIRNDGLMDLEGGAAIFGSPYFSSFPGYFLAAPATTDGLVLTFAPEVAGDFEATLILESNDPLQPRIEIPVRGTAVEDSGTGNDVDGDGQEDGVNGDAATPAVISSEVKGCSCAVAPERPWALLGLFGGVLGLALRRRR